MAQVVSVVLDGSEGNPPESVDLENVLSLCRCLPRGGRRGADVDVGFLACADAVARAVEGALLRVRVQGEVVEAAVGEAVAVIFFGCYSVSVEIIGKGEGGKGGKVEGIGGVSEGGGGFHTFGVLGPSDEVRFGEGGDRFLHPAAGAEV